VYLTSQQVSKLDYDGLKAFLERQIVEGHHLDYKRALTDGSDEKRNREFLKDVVAFANANGGDLLIGVKEPAEGVSADDQMAGVEGGEDLARDLERLTSSGAIDSRIPGLLVQPVLLPSSRWVVVVHIPPSSARPHVVNYKKQTYLMQRHSESNQPMTSFDIREAVLASATAEGRARACALEQKNRTLSTLPYPGRPWFVFQATPLSGVGTPIDVSSEAVKMAILGTDRGSHFSHGEQLSFAVGVGIRPTLEGISSEGHCQRRSRQMGSRATVPLPKDHGEDCLHPRWFSELHKNGYISGVYRLPFYLCGQTSEGASFDPIGMECGYLFSAFGELCDELMQSVGIDVPFAVDCLLTHASETRYVTANPHREWLSDGRADMEWPTARRQPGESFGSIMEDFICILRNAYGIK
jgi:hypothetical protein